MAIHLHIVLWDKKRRLYKNLTYKLIIIIVKVGESLKLVSPWPHLSLMDRHKITMGDNHTIVMVISNPQCLELYHLV